MPFGGSRNLRIELYAADPLWEFIKFIGKRVVRVQRKDHTAEGKLKVDAQGHVACTTSYPPRSDVETSIQATFDRAQPPTKQVTWDTFAPGAAAVIRRACGTEESKAQQRQHQHQHQQQHQQSCRQTTGGSACGF